MKRDIKVSILIFWSVCMLVSSFILVNFSEAKPVKLTLISDYAKDRLWNKYLLQWVEKVNKSSKGELLIQWRGGPEVVSPFENLSPVSKGTFDLVCSTPAYHPNVVPEGTGLQLSKATPMEHRKIGSLKIVDEAYRKRANLTIIGWAFHGQGFGTLSVKPVYKLADFKGLKARCVPQWVAVAKALGMSPITLSIPETYSAIEKGIADAMLFVYDPTIYENGWYDHLKFIIRPNLFYVTTGLILINVDKWNQLSTEQQGLLTDSIKALEPELYEFYSDLTEKEIKRAVSLGLTEVQLPEDDAREYVRRQFQAMWNEFGASTPDAAEKLKKILPIPKELLQP